MSPAALHLCCYIFCLLIVSKYLQSWESTGIINFVLFCAHDSFALIRGGEHHLTSLVPIYHQTESRCGRPQGLTCEQATSSPSQSWQQCILVHTPALEPQDSLRNACTCGQKFLMLDRILAFACHGLPRQRPPEPDQS